MNKTKAHPEWKILVEKYSGADYGTMVRHEDIEALTGLSRTNDPMAYYRQTVRWKRAMLDDHEREIQVTVNEGYRLVLPDEYRAQARRQIKAARKRSRKAVKISVYAPLDLMSEKERPKMIEALAHIQALAHFVQETLKKTALSAKEPRAAKQLAVGDIKEIAD